MRAVDKQKKQIDELMKIQFDNRIVPEVNPGGAAKLKEHKESDEDVDISDEDQLEVKKWLEEVVELGQYYDKFAKNDFNSLNIVREIEDEKTLEKMGIVSVGHQMKIKNAIKALRGGVEGQFQEGDGNQTVEGDAITGGDEQDIDDEFIVEDENDAETILIPPVFD